MTIPPIFVSNTMVDLIKRVQQVIDELNTNVLKVGDVTESANAEFALEANNTAFFGGQPPEYYLVGTAENANNSAYLNGKTEAQLNVNSAVFANTANNASYAFGKSEVSLNVNNALTANSATYLGAKQEAGLNVNSAVNANTANNATYAFGKQESALNVNSALTANSATYLGSKQEAGLNVNSAVNANTANNATYAFGKSEGGLNVNSASNSDYLDGQHGSYYTNASNLGTGTVPVARLSGTATNLTANNATYAYGKQESALNVNSAVSSNTANSATYLGAKQEAGLNVNSALTANSSTYLGSKQEAGLNVNSALTSNNTINLGGQPADYYTNASHLSTGTVAPQRLGSGSPDGSVFLAGDGTWKAPNTVPGTVENANNATYLGGKAEADLNVNSAVWLTGNAVTTNSSALRVGNSTVYTTVNSSAFSGTANSATYLGSKQEAGLNVNSAVSSNTANSATYLGTKQEAGLNVNSALTSNNTTYAYGKTEGNLNANSALSANNADYLDGQHGAYYTNASNLGTGTIPVARLSGTASNLTANNATYAYGKNENALNVNSAVSSNTANSATYLGTKQEAGLNVNSALTANNSTNAFGKTEGNLNANSALSANNADYLDSQHGSYYTNASNLGTGTVPVARLSGTATNLTANNATYAYGKSESGLNANSALTANAADYLDGQHGSYYTNASNLGTGTLPDTRLSSNVVLVTGTSNNATYAFGKQESALNVNSALTANAADYLDGQHGAFYQNASNLSTGTVPFARLTDANTTVNGVVTTVAQSFAGVKTFTANVVVGANTLFVSSANVVSVNASPNTSYALHISGDVNFTGTLYQNGTVAQFGGGNTAASFKKIDSIAAQFNGAQTVFSLLSGGVSCAVTVENQLLISLDGTIQEPGVSFTASGSTITFTTAPYAGMTFFGLRFGQPVDVGDATSLNGKAEAALNVNSASTALTANNSTYAFGKSEAGLNVNSALNANNSTNFAGQGQSYYTNASNLGSGTVPVARLSGTATNLTANNATYAFGKSEGGLNVNNATTAYGKAEGALNANSALTANNATYAFGKSEGGLNVNSASNSDYLDGQHGAYYTNASNLGTGTLPDARLSSNVAMRNANNAFTGLLAANTTVNGSYVLNITGDINYVGNLYQNGVLAQFGGAGGAVTSDTPPADPANGALWWDSTVGMLRIYYNDGSSSQWVDAFSGGQSILNIGADATLRNVTANSLTISVNVAAATDVAKFENTNAAGFTGVILNRSADVRYALLKYATNNVIDWTMGIHYNGGGTHSTFAIGPDIHLANTKLSLTTAGNFAVAGSMTERGRTAAMGEWVDYTPQWGSQLAPSPTIGNGTLVGRYARVGKTVTFTMKLTYGSNSTAGNGYWTFTLPTSRASGCPVVFPVRLTDNQSRYYDGVTLDISGATFAVLVLDASATAQLNSPMVWATGDEIIVSGSYEEA